MTGRILLAHGSGGGAARELIAEEFLPRFGRGPLAGLPDAASLTATSVELCFTTDSYVVQPLEFPGGNIGHLAVHGTVNDLAVSGARPRWLSLGLIIEEGLERAVLTRVLDAVAAAARDCEVEVVTGDTKVVRRGQADGLYVNTSGIGEAIPGFALDPGSARPGDAVLVSGTLGDHGMAVLAAREALPLSLGPTSDTAPVHRLVAAATPWAADIRFMRDPTRGGLAAVLNEIVAGRGVGIEIQEASVPFCNTTRAAAELVGMDLLQVASEGRLVMLCAPQAAEPILAAWGALSEGRGARRIGAVTGEGGRVVLETPIGGRRLLDVPEGELLPRIC
jgi:hydrogenase expression/formation protein HypE